MPDLSPDEQQIVNVLERQLRDRIATTCSNNPRDRDGYLASLRQVCSQETDPSLPPASRKMKRLWLAAADQMERHNSMDPMEALLKILSMMKPHSRPVWLARLKARAIEAGSLDLLRLIKQYNEDVERNRPRLPDPSR